MSWLIATSIAFLVPDRTSRITSSGTACWGVGPWSSSAYFFSCKPEGGRFVRRRRRLGSQVLSRKVWATPSRVARMVPEMGPWPAVVGSLEGSHLSRRAAAKQAKTSVLSVCPNLRRKRIENDSDSSEESFVAAPAAIALGAGWVGKSCVLGSCRSQPPICEIRACRKGMILKAWGTRGEPCSLMSLVICLSPSVKTRESMSATCSPSLGTTGCSGRFRASGKCPQSS